MSCLYFHSPSATAQINGGEFYHVQQAAYAHAVPLWRTRDLHEIKDLLDLAPRDPHAEHAYLHTTLDQALAEHAENQAMWAAKYAAGTPGVPHTRNEHRAHLRDSLEAYLRVRSLPIEIAGVALQSANCELNAALVAGSDPIRLAAKIGGWGRQHAWIDGPDRTWAADVIDKALQAGIFRRGEWYVDEACDGLAKDAPERKWAETGWQEVTGLLRARADEPVVMSRSTDEQFPNPEIAGWRPPAGVRGPIEQPDLYGAWQMLDEPEQWRLAMTGLKAARPWAQLTPDLAYWTFGIGVSIYDLYAPDRVERVLAAAADDGQDGQVARTGFRTIAN